VFETEVEAEPKTKKCRGCDEETDPTTCWCGTPMTGAWVYHHEGHSPIPWGCCCHFNDGSEINCD
tara:strand:- start:16694 stop:16888 length:195 start_codon:yes stop_codon:yes gene_type:complete